MGIDGRIFPVSATPKKAKAGKGETHALTMAPDFGPVF